MHFAAFVCGAHKYTLFVFVLNFHYRYKKMRPPYRYYVPEWCRWLNADHASFLQPESLQGLNLYTYCGNNPIRRVDSKGTDWNSFWNDVGDYFKTNWDAIVGTIASIALVAGGIAVTIVSAGALSWLGGTMVGAGIGGFIGGI